MILPNITVYFVFHDIPLEDRPNWRYIYKKTRKTIIIFDAYNRSIMMTVDDLFVGSTQKSISVRIITARCVGPISRVSRSCFLNALAARKELS